MPKVERAEFARLFRGCASSYPSEPEGVRHVHAYEENRRQGRKNFQAIVGAADRREDVTDLVC
jgi:5-methylcytosine-specific restriction protein B